MEKSLFLSMPREQQRSALEAILFASDDALSSRALYKLLVEADEVAARQEQQESGNGNGTETAPTPEGEVAQADDAPQIVTLTVQKQTARQVKQKDLTGLFEALVTEINEELESTGRAFRIVRVAGGYQFATTAMHGELVARLVKSKSKRRLSQAALETLAIIAYRQPVTKPEIEAIRGVSCNEVVNTLLEKNLVTIAGRSDTIGKPLLYGTTDEFLRSFGLHDISDLPKPRELEELMERRADILNVDTVVFAEDENVADFEERLPHHIRSEAPSATTGADAVPASETAPSAEPDEQIPDSTEPEEITALEQVEEQPIPEAVMLETTDIAEPDEQNAQDEQATDTPQEHQEEPSEQNGDEQTQPRERKMKVVMSVNGR